MIVATTIASLDHREIRTLQLHRPQTIARRIVVLAAIAGALCVLGPGATPAGAAAAIGRQTTKSTSSTASGATSDSGSSDVTITTAVAPGGTAPNGGPLLVPGASDAPASAAAGTSDRDRTGTVVAFVVAGLLVVALLLGLLTYLYWRATRPVRPATSSDEPAGVI